MLAGALWKSPGGAWYALAAGGGSVTSVAVTGGVRGTAQGPLLAVPARQGAQAQVTARLADGTRLAPLR